MKKLFELKTLFEKGYKGDLESICKTIHTSNGSFILTAFILTAFIFILSVFVYATDTSDQIVYRNQEGEIFLCPKTMNYGRNMCLIKNSTVTCFNVMNESWPRTSTIIYCAPCRDYYVKSYSVMGQCTIAP